MWRTDARDYRGSVAQESAAAAAFRGGRVSRRACEPWAGSEYAAEDYPDAGLTGNACRNPDHDVHGAWCVVRETSQGYGRSPCDVGAPSFDPRLRFNMIQTR